MNSSNKTFSIILALLCVAAAATGGYWYGSHAKSSGNPAEEPAYKTYVSEKLQFQLDYPAGYEVKEGPDNVVFSVKGLDGPGSGIAVVTEPTSFASAQDWLDAQPKGSASAAGFQPILAMNEMLLVGKYIVVDSDGPKQIYGRLLYAVAVHSGKLYKINIGGESPATGTLKIGKGDAAIITSFSSK